MIQYPEYNNKTTEELKKALDDLRAQLEEIEDEKELVLGQSGHHVQSAIYADKFETEAKNAAAKIAYIEDLLSVAK